MNLFRSLDHQIRHKQHQSQHRHIQLSHAPVSVFPFDPEGDDTVLIFLNLISQLPLTDFVEIAH